MRIIRKVLLTISPILLAGCVSGTIAGSGKSYSHLEDPQVTVDKVRNELGDPIFSRSYRPPRKIKDTYEYRAREAEYPKFPPVIIAEESGSGFSYGEERIISLCEVYRPHGWYAERETQAYGMIGAMTLGIGDVAMIPSTLAQKAKYMKDGVWVTFWYDNNGKYVATYSRDITASRKKVTNT